MGKNTESKIKYTVRILQSQARLPGSFLGFLNGMKGTPSANASGAPKMKPLASNPDTKQNKSKILSRMMCTMEVCENQ